MLNVARTHGLIGKKVSLRTGNRETLRGICFWHLYSFSVLICSGVAPTLPSIRADNGSEQHGDDVCKSCGSNLNIMGEFCCLRNHQPWGSGEGAVNHAVAIIFDLWAWPVSDMANMLRVLIDLALQLSNPLTVSVGSSGYISKKTLLASF